MKLILTSYGLKGNLLQEAQKLLPKSAKDCRVAFITTAAYGEEDNPQWFPKYRKELTDLGISDIQDVDLRDFTSESLNNLLAEKDVVYVNGGNTFFLLYYARKSGFEKTIRKFLDRGGLYIGVSAGSIICCPTIEVAAYNLGPDFPADENTIGITDMTAMNLVPFLVQPHIRKEYLSLIEEESKNASLPQVLITDMQAVVVEGNKTYLVGEGEQITSKSLHIFPLPR